MARRRISGVKRGGGSGWGGSGGKSTAKGRRTQYKASARRMNTVRTNVAFSRGEDLPF